MPILPLDHPEQFAATLGVMLYPATDETDPPKARAFVWPLSIYASVEFSFATETSPRFDEPHFVGLYQKGIVTSLATGFALRSVVVYLLIGPKLRALRALR